MADNKWLRNSFVYLIIFVAVIALWFTIVNPSSSEVQMPINTLVAKIKAGEIERIVSTEGSNRHVGCGLSHQPERAGVRAPTG